MLGASAVGALFSSTSPDFGAAGVLDRFGQIEPTVLFATNDYEYNGTVHDRRQVRDEIVDGLPSVRRTVIVGSAGAAGFEAFLAPHRGERAPITRRSFHHPWYLLASTRTTWTPNGIVPEIGRSAGRGIVFEKVSTQGAR